MRCTITLFLHLFVLCLLAPCAWAEQPQAAPGAAADPVVAVVNGKELTESMYKTFLYRQVSYGYLDLFIDYMLVDGESHRLGITVTAELEKTWIENKIRLTQSIPEYKDANFDTEDLRRRYAPQARMGYLLEELILRGRTTTPAIDKAYRKGYGERRHARHILFRLPPDADAATIDSVRLKAVQAIEFCKRGAEFADLARKQSEDTATARSGGELPVFGRGDMAPAFEAAAFALADGEVSQPVRTQYGWHVIQVVEVLEATRPLDPALRIEIVRRELQRPVGRDEVSKLIESLRQSAKIERKLK